MATGSWAKVGPFSGCAEYVLEHRLWFGLAATADENDDYDHVCAADRPHGDASAGAALPVQRTSRAGLDRQVVVSTSCGLSRFFGTLRRPGSGILVRDHFVVFTGLEVKRCGGGEIHVVKHRSELYPLVNKLLHWELTLQEAGTIAFSILKQVVEGR
ncbi:hypothetical protein EJB05_04144, partial [Eragrostis curvula]